MQNQPNDNDQYVPTAFELLIIEWAKEKLGIKEN